VILETKIRCLCLWLRGLCSFHLFTLFTRGPNMNGFKLKCHFCGDNSEKTDRLWLRSINAVDYLICALHKRLFRLGVDRSY
jgi:hypothetical protein